MEQKKAKALRRHLPRVLFVTVLAGLLAAAAAAFIWLGVYNIAADAPHTPAVYALLEELRQRSISVRARDISPPADLGTSTRISAGAGLYAEMCSACHRGPGVERSELSQGLYPPAPELAKEHDLGPAEQFWIIKHGVKLSAMPAWGRTHSDNLIWDMVAFVRKLPSLSPEQYHRLIASAPEDHDEMMKNMHDH